MAWIIKALTLGMLRNSNKLLYLYGTGMEGKFTVPLLAYLLTDSETGEKIMVDTGGPVEEIGQRKHPPVGYTQSEEQSIESALGYNSEQFENISLVIMTHLHWDHSSNINKFTGADILLQKDELDYALNPLPIHSGLYENTGVLKPAWIESRSRFNVINGDQTIRKGISVVKVPGHTPGSQGIIVEGIEKNYFLAGDTIPLYDNWYGVGPMRHVPNGIHHSLVDFYRSFEKIEELNAEVIPSHDLKVCNKVFK